MSICCPRCNNTNTKKNCHIHSGKQNHYCNQCFRQFVDNPKQILISDAKRERIRKLLLERISLRGICRAEGVSLRWLLGFITDLYGDQSHRTIQLHVETKGISFGPAVSFLFQEVGESHWCHQVFHLSLQSRQSITCIALPRAMGSR